MGPSGTVAAQSGEVFEALGALCRRPGYIHALAYLVLRDSFVFVEDRVRAEHMLKFFSDRTLIRTELMTLAGLMVQGRVETTLPPRGAVADWVAKTDALMEELHRCMDREGRPEEEADAGRGSTDQVCQQRAGKSFREPIFYAGESAYAFQYRDLAPLKYRADAGWMCAAKGFDPALGPAVVGCVADILREKGESVAEAFLAGTPAGSWTPLAALSFSVDAVVERVGHDADGVRSLIDAFVLPSGERNRSFAGMSEFNVAYAYPLLRVGDDEFVLMHPYGLAEAFYDSPFYWMSGEPNYRDLGCTQPRPVRRVVLLSSAWRGFSVGSRSTATSRWWVVRADFWVRSTCSCCLAGAQSWSRRNPSG